MNSGENCCGRVDGTGRNIEGSTRGPRGPKNLKNERPYLKEKAKTLSRCFEPLDTGEQREGGGCSGFSKKIGSTGASCCHQGFISSFMFFDSTKIQFHRLNLRSGLDFACA